MEFEFCPLKHSTWTEKRRRQTGIHDDLTYLFLTIHCPENVLIQVMNSEKRRKCHIYIIILRVHQIH
jgi:hypothetical protein